MGGKFLKISYEFFTDTAKDNLFKRIGTNGFCLYTYLLMRQSGGSHCEVNVKMIQSFLNRSYKSRKDLFYGNKNHKVKLLKDKNTIAKYLKVLQNNKLIDICEDIPSSINDFIIIKVKENGFYKNDKVNKDKIINNETDKNLFIPMAEELFVDYIHKIGGTGWSILCLLAKLFNNNFGSMSCEGFANPSQEYISSIIKVDKDTVRAYCELLQELKLIKILPQEPILKCIDYDGNNVFEYLPHNYIVKCKTQGNKYYVDMIG